MATSNKKIAIKLGWLPVNIVLLIVTLLAVSVIIIYQQNTSSQQQSEQTRQYQQQIFSILTQQLTKGIERWQNQVKQLAQREGAQLLQMSTYEQMLWQQEQLANFAEADHLCVIYEVPTAPVNDGCLPITYASLEQLRKLQKTGKAEAVYIPAGDASHLLFVERLQADQSTSPILMVAISSEAFKKLVPDALESKNYVELVQGGDTATAISRYGQAQLKTASAQLQKSIPSSYFRVNYWGDHVATSMSWIVLLAVTVVLLIAWLIQHVWLKVLLRHDADCICQQISDYEELALKPSYTLALAPLRVVTDSMQRLAALAGKSKTVAPKQKQLIAESKADESDFDAPRPSIADPTVQSFTRSEFPAQGIIVDEDISDMDVATFDEPIQELVTESIEPTAMPNQVIEEEESEFNPEQIEALELETVVPEEDNTIEFSPHIKSESESELSEIDKNDFSQQQIGAELDTPEEETFSDELTLNFETDTVAEPETTRETLSDPIASDNLTEVKDEKSDPPIGDVPDALLKLWEKKE